MHKGSLPKVITFNQAQELIRQAQAKELVTVLVQRVFDAIHIRHTILLKELSPLA